jgi:hypothetical protein
LAAYDPILHLLLHVAEMRQIAVKTAVLLEQLFANLMDLFDYRIVIHMATPAINSCGVQISGGSYPLERQTS